MQKCLKLLIQSTKNGEDQKYYLEKQASLLELALSVSKFYEYRVKFDREGQQNRFTRRGDKSSVKV